MVDVAKIYGVDAPASGGVDAFATTMASPLWVVPGWASGTPASYSIGSGNLFYLPIHVYESTTFDRIGVEVIGAVGGGSLARLGIYEDSSGRPGDLLLDAGTVSIAANAEVSIVINQTLSGHYFLCYVGDDTASIRCMDEDYIIRSPGQGQDDALALSAYLAAYKTGQSGLVAAGLSDPATQPDTLLYYYLGINLRVA